jgi:hypothetical protein
LTNVYNVIRKTQTEKIFQKDINTIETRGKIMLAESTKFRLFKLFIIIPLLWITNPEKLIATESRDASAVDSKIERSAEFLLNKMLEHRSKVKNLQYVAENKIWEDPTARKKTVEDHIKMMRARGMPERQLESWRRSMSQVPETRYQILKCTTDNAGHAKIEMTSGTYDSSDKKVPNDDKHVWAWNGVSETQFSQRSGSLGSATIRDSPRTATVYGHPWRSYTGIFCKFLEETIAAEKQISVDELQGGTYRIAFNYKTSRYMAIIEPSQGYTCSLREGYNKQGKLYSRNTAKYEEVAGGIWFPVSGQTERYADDGSLHGKHTFKSSQIRINDPSFNENYFDVNMPKGAHVRDYTRSAEQPEIYHYGELRKNYDEILQSGSKFVAGSVTDENGSPVPGVRVEVCGHKKVRADGRFYWTFSGSFDIFNAVTDSEGRFAIELKEDGFYNLRFSPEKHAAIMAYDVPVGKRDLKVIVPEGGTISGRVVRIEDGQKIPIPSVEVKAEQSDRSTYSHLGFNRDRKTITDSQGRFQFNHLRTKMRSVETRTLEKWQYLPRAWTISYEKTSRTVVFYEGAKTEGIELVVEPDYTNPVSLIDKPLPGFENIKTDFNPDQAKDGRILICFWDMNQRPSRNCIFELVKRTKRLEEKSVAIVLIQASGINENKLKEWIKNNEIPFPIGTIIGNEEKIRFNWGVRSLPWLILADRNHIVRDEGFSVSELNKRIAMLRKK